jgi:hypothetical protein|tara:strand:- start:336 stop:569 length:234 start_codon:yes stop_codon:yes gene_type:complete
MKLSAIISFPVFIISLSIGLLFVYLSTPPPTVIYVYPTPENINKVEYKDKADNCYQFKSTEVSCVNTEDIKTIPIQK